MLSTTYFEYMYRGGIEFGQKTTLRGKSKDISMIPLPSSGRINFLFTQS